MKLLIKSKNFLTNKNNNMNGYGDKLASLGLSLRKIHQLSNPVVNTQRCICNQLLNQGDCKLKEIVEQVRRSNL